MQILPYGRERRRRREQHTASLGWASRLALQQGLALAAKAAGTRAEEPTEPTDDKEGRGRKEESADDGGNTAEEDDQDLSGFDDAGPDDGEEGRGTQMMEEKGADEVACLEAMRHFACAVELAFRGRCWAAVYNACGDMWDALKMILEASMEGSGAVERSGKAQRGQPCQVQSEKRWHDRATEAMLTGRIS